MRREPELFPKTVYCIDTSSLINLKPFRRDVFPTIWSKLESMIKNGELIAPLEVYGEIEIGKDKIYDWCKSNKEMFKDIDECQIQKLQRSEEARYDHRLHGVLLVASDHTCTEVARLFGEDRRTIQRWVSRFEASGFDGIREGDHPGRPTKLDDEQWTNIAAALRKSPRDFGS